MARRTNPPSQNGEARKAEPKSDGPWLVCAKEITSQVTEWLFEDRIERHEVSILQGDKGVAKSTWARALVAYLTGGTAIPGFKSRKKNPANVIWYASEESLEKRVQPGLEAAGANMARVFCSDCYGRDGRRPLRLPVDGDHLIEQVRANKIELVFIDPIFNFTSPGVELESSGESARAFMTELLRICRAAPTTILFSRNITKDRSRGALAAGRGRGELGNMARAVFHLGILPDGESYAMAAAAINSGKVPPAIRYQIGTHKKQSVIKVIGELDITADEILAGEGGNTERSQLARAKALIRQMIPGERLDSKIVKSKADETMIGVRTLQAAAQQMGIQYQQEGSRENTVVYWLPPEGGWPE